MLSNKEAQLRDKASHTVLAELKKSEPFKQETKASRVDDHVLYYHTTSIIIILLQLSSIIMAFVFQNFKM